MAKLFRLCALVICVLITSLRLGYAAGADCDPNAILRQNVSQYNENLAVCNRSQPLWFAPVYEANAVVV